ncbi:MAG: hypothetical protein QXV32_09470 [Conexivisphaerales archaeon]
MAEKRYPTGTAAKKLGISFLTLKRWIYSGKVKAEREEHSWKMLCTRVGDSQASLYCRREAKRGEEEVHSLRESIIARAERHLKSQVERLTKHASERGYDIVNVYEEVA